MARETLSVQLATRGGITPAFTAAVTDGHSFPNSGRQLLRLRNTSGAAVTVSVPYTGPLPDQLTASSLAITVPATTGDVITAFWEPTDYNQPDAEQVWLNYSATTGVTVAVIGL